jgi:hypothetical protein
MSVFMYLAHSRSAEYYMIADIMVATATVTNIAPIITSIITHRKMDTYTHHLGLLTPLVNLVVNGGRRYNLLNSAMLEFLELIRKVDCSYFISSYMIYVLFAFHMHTYTEFITIYDHYFLTLAHLCTCSSIACGCYFINQLAITIPLFDVISSLILLNRRTPKSSLPPSFNQI